MTSLGDKARGDGPEVVLPADQPEEPPVTPMGTELYDPNDLTPDGQFPEFGDFLRVCPVDEDGEIVEDEERYWSTPKALADVLVEWAEENEEEPTGLVVSVDSVHKTPNGEWRYVTAVSSL